ncbi:prepilin-type N-terminal cleavage/methylation domain-containing protein [Sulfurimonas sp. SAG-AH-194-I05]|nr:prepilin-type N-terminal cleavage/methylation domain-containing protein [Sulfurimonas sp. SAG-AH-194-I05]MDF1874203.1 prepilin-type N-terminal cleavage/methylation domain-containing protein [Sulfurimonas sp. SAG-AH-194-I05]
MKLRNAFTMLELIFVIVIMGIIGKFGVEFLAQAYRSFIYTSVNHSLQANSTSAIEFIAARLQYRIKDSIIAKVDSNASYTALASASGSEYNVLEWIASDIDGFRGDSLPYWSGIADIGNEIGAGNKDLLVSPETNTTALNTLIDILSDSGSGINDVALYFVGSSSDIYTGYGYAGAITDQNQTMHPVNSATDTTFTPAPATGSFTEVYEYYKLAWTANAIVHSSDGNLTFYYDYQPWNGENYAADGKGQLLMQNVDTFQFMAIGSIVKIQVCVKSDIIDGSSTGGYSLCKEKTIY